MNVFITGASSGIGKALAIEYAKRNTKSNSVIGLLARRSDELNQLAEKLTQQYQITCAVYACDIRNYEAVSQAALSFIKLYGAPHIVVANAGVSSGTHTQKSADINTFQAVMDINVMGMVHTFQPFIESMRLAKQKGEHAQLVGVASVAGIRGLPGAGAYSASKAAAITYLESLRVEMQHFNITVTTVAPGYIRTPMTDINPYHMPFLMEPDVFAFKFANAVAKHKRFVIIPWQMSLVAKLLKIIPNCLWDKLTKNAPKKPNITL